WPNFFLFVDKVLKFLGKSPIKPLRSLALKRALKWTLDHQEPEGDFSGIQPAMLNSMMALKLMGYKNDDPLLIKGFQAIDRFIIRRDDQLIFQACVSPLWDTSISCNALMDAGVPGDHPNIVKAGEWMLTKQVTRPGDWMVKNPNTPPGGWAFEFYNEPYPDCDDTAEILMALERTAIGDTEWKEKEMQRAFTWLFSMQSSNGGWAAFDQDNDHELFNQIPFADHGAMLDPPTVDVTGRVLWMLGRINHNPNDPMVQRAIRFIKSEQEDDGCWFGRWGVNYIYGTWLVLTGLRSIGEDPSQAYIRKAAEWLKEHQNEDGGWGETCRTYEEPHLRGKGKSTKSQTAWALMGLMEADATESPAVKRGIDYLIQQQKADGSWYEDQFTGTGFPIHFYIKYHMYQIFFPLMALARYRNKTGS
ncbi:MAG: squalene--hopene cyclase, partial [Nitrospinota bacterium]|nr:squalene--hopene cyclase [Nitrospinota bacterium]